MDTLRFFLQIIEGYWLAFFIWYLIDGVMLCSPNGTPITLPFGMKGHSIPIHRPVQPSSPFVS
jgi:hypothetical protein